MPFWGSLTHLSIFNSRMKKFIIKIFTYVFITLFVIAMVSYYGDAGRLFYKRDVYKIIVQNMLAGKFVHGSLNLDERLLKKEVIEKEKKTPNKIIIGSSRVMQLTAKIVGDSSFQNHWLPANSIEDMAAILDLYQKKGKLPNTIILGIDPWILNKNNDQLLYKSIKDNYISFFSYQESQFLWEFLSDKINTAAQLFYPYYVLASITKLFQPDRLIITDTLIKNLDARLPDGSIQYNEERSNPTVYEREKKVNEDLSIGLFGIEGFNAIDSRKKQELETILKFMIQRNIHITIILSPYYPKMYNHIYNTSKYRNVLLSEIYFRKLSSKYGIALKGSFNPYVLHLSNEDFIDALHLKKEATEKIYLQ